MGFTYTRDIPDGPHDPSVDQPQMKINTNSIDSLIAVDHYSFNVASVGGTHKQVEFGGSNVPVAAPTFPTAFVKSPATGVPNHLFVYTGTAVQGADQYEVDTSNISTFMLGGMIMKAGKTAAFASGAQVISYTTLSTGTLADFPKAAVAVVVSPIGSGSAKVTAISTTGFTLNVDVVFPSTASFYFIAIGY